MKDEVDILNYLVSNIRNSMNEMADHISTGGCESFDAYTKCCGIIHGLAVAEREILDLKSKYEEAQRLWALTQCSDSRRNPSATTPVIRCKRLS